MQSTEEDSASSPGLIEINGERSINSVCFSQNGRVIWSGGDEGMVRRWKLSDGQEAGDTIRVEGAQVCAIVLSPDEKRLVCGLWRLETDSSRNAYAGVWDAETYEKIFDIHDHTSSVCSVDVSPDSAKFATADNATFIWSMSTGERLVGPLVHHHTVVALRFSPDGDRIAVAAPRIDCVSVYNSDNGDLLLCIKPSYVEPSLSSPLAWSSDGHRLLVFSCGKTICFDSHSGSVLSSWSIPQYSAPPSSIALSHNQKFVVTATSRILSFWDTSLHTRIGNVIEHASDIWSIALCPDDTYIATGEGNGKLTFRNLQDILPVSYFLIDCLQSLELPLLAHIGDPAFTYWIQGNLTQVERHLTNRIVHPSDSLHLARALAYRALVRCRSKRYNMAMDDAKESIKVQRSAIGYIANALALFGDGKHDLAIRAFDLAFIDGLSSENNLLLLVKAVFFFECEKHDDAISRVDDLIDAMDDKSAYVAVRAYMFNLLGSMSLRRGHYEQAIELLHRAGEVTPLQPSPFLTVISLIFGWDFDGLALSIQQHLQECSKPVEDVGDEKMQSNKPEEAIMNYSAALSLNPPNPARLLVKRSKARAILGSWEDALMDANEAIRANPQSPWGFERKHAAQHALQNYNEAFEAFSQMISLIEQSTDEETRQIGKKYVSLSRSHNEIDNAIRGVFKTCPLELIDVHSGRLCDVIERLQIFKSELPFKQLVSSMTEELDNGQILQVVTQYFRYVTFSHVWQGREPSYQDVKLAETVWSLASSPLNDKLRKFCEVVRSDGIRWAWSDTCCIDKTISTVLNQSLTMMYKWYEASATTFVWLADVDSPSAPGDLTDSIWMTRAWTAQELLAARMIRFYDRNWNPYLGDTRSNHKDSPEIMQEVVDAVGIARQTITAFNPDELSVREKLRLASTRSATVEEDIAYSLIGIFKSDIRPHYGEGDAALGHLLEEIVARSGEVTVLAWTGKSSGYNSCLPTSLAVYSQMHRTSPDIGEDDMEIRLTQLRSSISQMDAMLIYDRITRLPPARFANRRLNLPCILFAVRKLAIKSSGQGEEKCYRARVSGGIGHVEFQTADALSTAEPGRLVFVHPWIRDLRDAYDHLIWRSGDESGSQSEADSDSEGLPTDAEVSDLEPTSSPSPSRNSRITLATTFAMDSYTRALRLLVRLQSPFHALLLQQQPNGEFKRVAAEHEIAIAAVEHRTNYIKGIHTEILEIL